MKTSHVVSLCALLFGVTLAGLPPTAHAHPAGTSARIGLGIPALSVIYFPGVPIDRIQVLYGINQLTFGAHMGMQVSPEVGLVLHVLAGGRYADGRVSGESNFMTLSVAPRFEYMFSPHDSFAPYLGLEAGYAANGDPNANMRDMVRAGGFLGAHIFAVSELSIDLELAANFLYDVDNQRAGFQGTFYLSTTGWLD